MNILESINPSNYQVIGTVHISSAQEVEEKFLLAKDAQKSWLDAGLTKRISYVREAFDFLRNRKNEFVLLESREMGMPIKEAAADFDSTFAYAQWYFDNAEKYLSPETTFENNNEIHQVQYEPLGVGAVIIPWNFPFANFVWGALQALIAGNTILLKHSEECPLSGKFIEDCINKFLPKGVFNEVYGDGTVGQLLVHQDINFILFTGSTKTGQALYELAGKKFIKAAMELGGSAPGIIFADADLEIAIQTVCASRLLNQGQCCDGLKRLIVHEDVVEKILPKIIEIFNAKKVGHAENEENEIGPLVAKRQLDLVCSQIEDAKEKGAEILCGGQSLEKKLGGAFFEPTVLSKISKDMRVWKEEVFGPVLPVVTFKTEEEAIMIANETMYGLGAYIFSKDSVLAQRVAEKIQSGMVSINGVNYIIPCNPFGGYKNSGFGREHGKYGFHEVTQVKVIVKEK